MFLKLLAQHPYIILLLFLLLGFIVIILLDPYIRWRNRKIMLIIAVLVISLVSQNCIEYILTEWEPHPFQRIIVAIYGYSVRPVIILLFFYIIDSGRKYRIEWVIAGINLAVHMTALFSDICFTIGETNHYGGGPLCNFCLYVSVLFLAELLVLTILRYNPTRKRGIVIPILVVVLIAVSWMTDAYGEDSYFLPTDYLTIGIAYGCVLYYIWLHLRFVRRHEQDLMMAQRLNIMLSQIKPHFLYNSLGAIEELCDSNPKAARDATRKFARYLRGNMDALTAASAIPFEKELDHTRLYLKLEQLRFEDALKVRYDISCIDFTIPTLTLEPLAENAVRHGIRAKESGSGTVTISAKEFPDHYEVSVTDDGPGFDPDQVPGGNGGTRTDRAQGQRPGEGAGIGHWLKRNTDKGAGIGRIPERRKGGIREQLFDHVTDPDPGKSRGDGRSHVGIRNVRERLAAVCGGTLVIHSVPGEGTTATIMLPK